MKSGLNQMNFGNFFIRGGTSSGSCASSFGVCCVFTLACGGTSSANNTYATISSYNLNTDADPCTYTFCKTNSDVCRMKIEYNTMVLAPPGIFLRVFCKDVLLVCTVLGLVSETSHLIGRHSAVQLKPPPYI